MLCRCTHIHMCRQEANKLKERCLGQKDKNNTWKKIKKEQREKERPTRNPKEMARKKG